MMSKMDKWMKVLAQALILRDMIKTKYIGIICALVLFASCKKEAGEGGNSSIKGRVDLVLRNLLYNPNPADTFPAQDADVYIQYGDNLSPDDRILTNYNGEYEFLNLRPGDYTIYVYSKDTAQGLTILDPTEIVVKQLVTIEEKKQTVEAPLMRIYDSNN
jgi:hypothetical protein